MKIVFLSFYSGYVERGVETVVEELASRLSKKHKVIIFQAGPKSKKKNYKTVRIPLRMRWPEDYTGTFLRFLFLDYYSLKIFQFTIKSLLELRRYDCDIIYGLNGGWQTLLTRIFCLLYKKKLVIGGHAGVGWDDRVNLYCFPDAFISLSDRGEVWAEKVAPWVRIEKIPDGVNLEKFNPQIKAAKLNLPKPIIICVSALQDYKRIDLTVKGVAGLEKAGLLLIGSGDKKQEEDIDNLGKQLLGKGRFLRLSLPHHKMPNFYKAASLFTLVSQSSEAFAVVYLEAMACGLPVVATDDALRREIVGDAGLYIKNPENMRAYGKVLEKALKKEWKDIPRNQAEKFSWDKIAKKYEKVFESLI